MKIGKAARTALFFLFLLCTFGTGIAHAAIGNTNSKEENGFQNGPSLGNSTGSILKVIFFLALIIGLIILLIKFLAQKSKPWMSNRAMQVLGGVTLGQHKSLQVVRIGEALYIIGVGDDVNLLHRIDDAEETAALLDAFTVANGGNGDGFAKITDFLKKIRKSGKPEPAEEWDEASFQQLFEDRIKQVSSRRAQVGDLMREGSDPDRLRDDHE